MKIFSMFLNQVEMAVLISKTELLVWSFVYIKNIDAKMFLVDF